MINIANNRVLVFGLGVHGGGIGVAKWLVKQEPPSIVNRRLSKVEID